jgi:hypothetical protein
VPTGVASWRCSHGATRHQVELQFIVHRLPWREDQSSSQVTLSKHRLHEPVVKSSLQVSVDAASKKRLLLITFVERSRGFVLLERMTSVLEQRSQLGRTICDRAFGPRPSTVSGLARVSFSTLPGSLLFDCGLSPRFTLRATLMLNLTFQL